MSILILSDLSNFKSNISNCQQKQANNANVTLSATKCAHNATTTKTNNKWTSKI